MGVGYNAVCACLVVAYLSTAESYTVKVFIKLGPAIMWLMSDVILTWIMQQRNRLDRFLSPPCVDNLIKLFGAIFA